MIFGEDYYTIRIILKYTAITLTLRLTGTISYSQGNHREINVLSALRVYHINIYVKLAHTESPEENQQF